MFRFPIHPPKPQFACNVLRHEVPASCPMCGMREWVLVLVTPEGHDVYECLCGHVETVKGHQS